MVDDNRRKFIKSAGVAGTVGLGGLSGCIGGGIGGGGTPTINFNYVVPIENAASLLDVPEVREELENVGSAYELNVTRNASTPDSLNQMAAGEADVAMTTTVSFASAVNQDAVPNGISVVGVDFWDADPDYFSVTVFSGPDSEITEPADMEGKTLGVNALGTGVHSIYVKALQQAGLTQDDVEFVETPFPTMTSAIKDGKIDVGIYTALFSVGARSDGFTKVFESADLWDRAFPFAYATASKSSLDNKTEAMSAWVDDYAGLFEYVRNNRDSVVSAAATHFELPEALVDAFYFTQENGYRRDVRIDIDALQYIADDLVELGFLDQSVDVQQHATNEYLPGSGGDS
ncbi:ABC transporter substrate-binding protein [Halobium palmae]|uniref:ABC transporter substrate-binding protein n=1 Tax=Halobium palmae TaxID=1776492 RepID=A0ABD5RYY3_9EURY